MLIITKNKLNLEELKQCRKFLSDKNVDGIPVEKDMRHLFGGTGRCGELTRNEIRKHSLVSSIVEVDKTYKLSAKSSLSQKTKIKLGNSLTIGNKKIIIMAGPC